MASSGAQTIKQIVESRWFQGVVLVLIIVNALVLGLETFSGISPQMRALFADLDRLIIYAFVFEIVLRLLAYRSAYFRNGWNLFDFAIVGVSLLAATSGLGALRAFRVLRILRVITVIPRMRVVVSALLDSIPGIASVGVVLALILYVFAVIAANLYGPAHPALFGDVFRAMSTLFQVMTLEGWPDIAAAVAETHQRSWIFFFTFVLIATFTMLNLFVAIVVRVVEEDSEPIVDSVLSNQEAMRQELAEIKAHLERITNTPR